MKLEDLFKTKEPTNYVEQASQGGASPLQQFLKERTPKPATIAAPTPKAAAPIEQAKVDQIKAEYTPVVAEEPAVDYSMQSSYTRSPAMDAYVPVSELLDTEKIKRQAEELSPKAGLSDVLASLTPLAVEAIFGGKQAQGVSAGIAGESILGDLSQRQKRKQTLEDKLMELKKLSAPKADTEAGKMARFEAAQKERRSLADRQVILDTRNRLNQDKTWQAATKRYESTNDIINILNQRNWAADAGVGYQIAKGIFGEVGALTEQERTQYLSNPMINRRFNYLQEKFLKTGRFTEEDRADLVMLAVALREHAKASRQRVANSYVEGARSVGVDASGVINPLLTQADIEFSRTGKVDSKTKPATKMMFDKKGNAYKVKLNPKTGKYEYAD